MNPNNPAFDPVSDNVHALYRILGTRKGCGYGTASGFSWVKTNSAWPNCIFAAGEILGKADGLRVLREEINLRRLPSVIVLSGQEMAQVNQSALSKEATFLGKLTGMILKESNHVLPPAPTGMEIVGVTTAEEIEAWCRITEKVLFRGREQNRTLYSALAGRTDFVFLLGKYHGVPAATAMGFLQDGIAGIYMVATLPEFRGLGMGGSISSAVLRTPQMEGAGLAILQATNSGFSVYQRIGFISSVSFQIFRMPDV